MNRILASDWLRPVHLTIKGHRRVFDINAPNLPGWVSQHAFGSGHFPYERKLDSKQYAEQLRKLQIELVKMQFWLKSTGKRVMAVFEGRDAAGKDGAISAIREYLNPRSAHMVALGVPTQTEQTQWYFQRYIRHFPAAGEIILFNRSWYNRAGVEPVMEFCTPKQHRAFLHAVPRFEETLVDEGILFFKFWLDIGREMQLKRFHERRHDPRKIWKLSPMDMAAIAKWDDYSAKRNQMLKHTHKPVCPWVVVRANDKGRARLNVIRHILRSVPYEGRNRAAIGRIDDAILGEGPKFLK
ncbi:MAG: polyphosphate kinase 2 [Nevskiaceae bacterium]|jgi:polyphosphate kinase 2|nr:polyphosphate kinase 2 [Nevskiaceae bacterium]